MRVACRVADAWGARGVLPQSDECFRRAVCWVAGTWRVLMRPQNSASNRRLSQWPKLLKRVLDHFVVQL